MQIIYKYLANVGDTTLLSLPEGAKILTVQKQKEQICFWVLQTCEEATIKFRRILKVGTGHSFDDTKKYDYIGTVQELEGNLIWHYFEQLPT
jgi:hypothetical protein